MENESRQKIEKTEFQALIEKSDRQESLSSRLEFGKAFILPVTLAIISLSATQCINRQQEKNAKHLALKQIESAQIIAAANREHSARLFESDQKIERLNHIKGIFKEIITNEKMDHDTLIMQIRSLEVYKDDALSFLLNIKEHFNNQRSEDYAHKRGLFEQEAKDQLTALKDQTEGSITNILRNSQIDVADRLFMGEDDTLTMEEEKDIKEEIRDMANSIKEGTLKDFSDVFDFRKLIEPNMRKHKYTNYNFSNCIFINTNLYQASFSGCTLKNAVFIGVDLQEASFSESNLSNAIFIDCNLKRVDFMKSKLRGTFFHMPTLAGKRIKIKPKPDIRCELEDARFALGTLLNFTKLPFRHVFSDHENPKMKKGFEPLYINLLTPHKKRIKTLNEFGDEDLAALLKAFSPSKDHSSLEEKLQAEEEQMRKHTKRLLKEDSSLTASLEP